MALSDEERKARSLAASAKYRANNREKERARVARYKAENPEKTKAYAQANNTRAAAAARAWAKANPERYAEIQRRSESRPKRKTRHLNFSEEQKAARVQIVLAYKARNPEKVAATARAYKDANIEKILVNKQNRRKLAKLDGGRLSHGIRKKLMLLQRGRCAGCGADLSTAGCHLDHIMPLALGGAHADENIQLLCPPCNLEKNATHPVDWAQKKGRLL